MSISGNFSSLNLLCARNGFVCVAPVVVVVVVVVVAIAVIVVRLVAATCYYHHHHHCRLLRRRRRHHFFFLFFYFHFVFIFAIESFVLKVSMYRMAWHDIVSLYLPNANFSIQYDAINAFYLLLYTQIRTQTIRYTGTFMFAHSFQIFPNERTLFFLSFT